MCSSAATAFCVYMTYTASSPFSITTDTLNDVMQYAARLNRHVQTPTHRMLTVAEVVSRSDLDTRGWGVATKEVGGCVHDTPEAMQSELCMDFGALLTAIGAAQTCCAVTMRNHTTAVGRVEEQWWRFDSETGLLTHTDSLDTLLRALDLQERTHELYSAVVFTSSVPRKQ